MVFVTFSSLYSFSGVGTSTFSIPHLDKIVHFVFYFTAVLLGVLAFWESLKESVALLRAIFIMICAAIIFGMVIEVIQYVYTSDRQGDVFDVLANSLGAFFGGLAIKTYFSRKWALKWE